MDRMALRNYYPGSDNLAPRTNGEPEYSSNPVCPFFSFNGQEVAFKQLYRENADLRVRIEILEQTLQDQSNGLYRLLTYFNIDRLSDEKLWKDYFELKEQLGEKQRIIDEQNEMLDEAQTLMRQLMVLFVLLE